MIGTIVTLSSPESSEIMSLAGFHWVMIDMEHSTLSLSDVQRHLQALKGETVSIVRIPCNSQTWIKQVLDTGCDGIMVPMVNTEKEARQAVGWAMYPPSGSRSVGISRAQKYGFAFRDYVFEKSRSVKLIIQIEHIDGVNNLDEILRVEGISAIFIGPYDLSASMGRTGEVSHPEVQEAISLIKTKCKEKGMPWGIFGITPEAVAGEIAEGAEWILCGIDTQILSGGAGKIIRDLGQLNP